MNDPFKKHPNSHITTVHLFLIKKINNKKNILLLKRHNTGYEDGNYSVPAGHIEPGENAIQAMIRETFEETKVKLNEKQLKFCHIVDRFDKKIPESRLDFFFKSNNWNGDPTNGEPSKCSQLLWVEINNLPKKVIPYIKQAVECYEQNIKYSELGFKE